MSIPVVLHPEIVDFLRQLPESNFQERVWHCLQKLRAQQYDTGLRVKKLQGISKRIWEARIDRASRLIFTYEKSREPDTGNPQIYLAVQDICLDHDDVTRRARARSKTPEAEWLEATEMEAIAPAKKSTRTSKAKQEAEITAAMAEELAISPDFETDELLGNIQWQILETEAQWRQAIVSQDADLPLKLTPEESQIISIPGNLLLSGSAGTGKTTVALYRLLQSFQDIPKGKRLYIAYNPLLVSNAREQFHKLIGKSDRKLKTIVHFKTLRDLCLEILEAAGESYRAENEVTFQGFWEIYKAHPKRKQYPTAMLWDEIRSIIKGSQLSTEDNLLSKKDYERLSKKSISMMTKSQRYEVYKLAEWYQKKIEKDGRFDEIDLARQVLKIVQRGETETYRAIFCDEVQDFTDLQLELVMQLGNREGNFFFAGDLHQTIGPSGFRWEDLKDKFYQRDREAIEQSLAFNFRSVGTLVNLANQVLKLRSRLLNVALGQVSKPGVSRGEAARLIASDPEDLQPTLSGLNPSDALLVRSDEDKDKLSREFQSTLVFTIEEAKGLEFDTVFLVEFFQPNEELWERLFRTGSVKEKERSVLEFELNTLYVAVTRARRILNIWESSLSPIWKQPELIDLVLPLSPELVKNDRVEATPETWRDRGWYYMKAEFYRQAIECFEKAGDRSGEQQARARFAVQQRDYLQAAELFAELEDWETAATLFEKQKEWKKAAACWKHTKNKEGRQLAEIHGLEAAGKWENAAKRWEKRKDFEAAKRCWFNSDNKRKKAELLAAEYVEKKQWLKAAEQYTIAEMPEKAVECRALEFERKQQYDRAAQEYEALGNEEKAKECREKIQPPTLDDPVACGERGNERLNAGDYEGAIADYDRAIRMKPEFPYTYHNRAVAYHRLDRYEEAIADYSIAIARMPGKDPGLARSYGYRGAAHAAIQQYEEAIADYTEVLKIEPNDPMVYTNRGAALYRIRDYKGALADYTKVIEFDPTNALAYGNRGAARSAMGDFKGAVADLSKAIEYNNSLSQIYYQRGKARLAIGDYKAAIADFNIELKRSPELTEVYYQRGKAYLALKEYKRAIADFTREVERHPNTNAPLYNDRGVAFSSIKELQSALEDFNTAIGIDPTYDAPYNNRACVRRDLGDTEGSIADFDKAIEINPSYADAYYNRGVSYAVLDDIKTAVEDWTKSLELKPNNPIAYYNRGLGRVKQGDRQGGFTDYTQALHYNPQFAEAYYNRAVTQYHLKKFEAAIEDFENAAQIYSDRGDTAGSNQAKSKIEKIQSKLIELQQASSEEEIELIMGDDEDDEEE